MLNNVKIFAECKNLCIFTLSIKRNKKMENLKETITKHPNGEIKERYFENENGKKNGSYQRWYNNGQISCRCTYLNGKRDGLYERLSRNGEPSESCTYLNGKKNGLCRLWHDNGKPYQRYYYVNGTIHGLFQRWDENGEPKERRDYVNGVMHGVRKIWRNGGISFSYMYDNGVIVNNSTM